MSATHRLRGVLLDGAANEAGVLRTLGTRLALGDGPAEAEVSGWILPGLVDVHCHLGLGPDGAVDEATTLAQAAADLAAGTLLVRDAGSPVDTRWLQGRDDAPDLIRAGRHLARPKRYLRHFALELDDPDELPAEMARQARAGDGWVKIVGDWIDREEGERADLRPLWNAAQLRAGIGAAHAEGARVTVHTFAHESIADLLDAGIDCLEHGCGLDAGQIDAVAAAGIPVTPTLMQVDRFDRIADQAVRYPVYAAHMRRLHARRERHVRDLHEAGVRLLVGTDAGGSIGHGLIAAEAARLVQAGVPAPAVVAAASWDARAYLGRAGLADGAPADVVVYPADPRADIGVLAHPTAVFRRGVRIR